LKKFFLLTSAIGLSIISLTYGLSPQTLLVTLYGFPSDNVNLAHICRAIMFLYLGLAGFWVLGIAKPRYTDAAIMSNIFFMGGLAIGRLLSLALDGPAHWLLMIYLGLEIVMATWGILTLKLNKPENQLA
jgi:hypothetical protein